MSLCIADNLRLMRNKCGYTMENLAEIISVSRQTIAKWEAEESYPDIVNCMKLASLYKVSLDELVNMPLRDIATEEFSAKDGRIGGTIQVSEESMIRIPKSIMEMFDIHPGEKVLLLADKNQGIALVKCSQFE